MKKCISLLLVLLVLITNASAIIPANDNAKENSQAPEHSPVITVDWEKGLTRIDYIHYKEPKKVTRPAKPVTCYKLMGIKWFALPVNYVINPSNPQGLTEGFVTSAISMSAETWDSATSKELYNNTYTIDYTAPYGVFDGKNAVAFGLNSNTGVIAVTSVWYYTYTGEIAEYDMQFNTYFIWGDAAFDPSVMDLQNIATHEKGHSVGLADIYTSSCGYVTMYGYSSYGETIKRTLESPDIYGLQSIYGS